MATFEEAIPVVLDHEGVYSNLRGDPGGATHFGWSTPECERLGICPPESREAAIPLYQKYFWNSLWNALTSQKVATKIFDDSVNQGAEEATTNLQKALNQVGSTVTVDGAFGPATLTATLLVPETLLLPYMRGQQWLSYLRWIAKNPARQELKHGLANRAAWPDPDQSIAALLMKGGMNVVKAP